MATGLLGDSWDDPRTSMMLALASGLLGGRGNLAQNLGAGLQAAIPAYQGASKLADARELHKAQINEYRAQAAQREAAMRRQEQMDKGFANVIQKPYMGADQGPPIPPELARPVLDRNAYEQWLAQYKPDEFVKLQLQREKPDASKLPSDYQNFLLAKAGGYDKEFFDYQRELRQAGAINIPQPVVPTQDANGNWVYGIAPTRGGGKAVVTDLTAPTPSSERDRTPQPRPLPNAAVNDLTKKSEFLINMRDTAATFKDEYAGSMVNQLGRAHNFASRNLPFFEEDRGNWWQKMDALDAEVRHGLYGASLTATEKANWERATVEPGMKPEAIKTNLAVRAKILESATERLAKTWAANGYSPEAIEAATGIRVSAPASATAPSVPRRPSSSGKSKPLSEMSVEELEERKRQLQGKR